MPIELSHLMQLALGTKKSLQVGDLPEAVAQHMGCHPAIVFLGHRELIKITKKHQEIEVTEFQYLSIAIREGCYRTDDQDRLHHVTVLYERPDNGVTYLIGLKAAEKGREVWIATYYPISGRRLTKKERKTTIIYQK